jgi:hypothetical protein
MAVSKLWDSDGFTALWWQTIHFCVYLIKIESVLFVRK